MTHAALPSAVREWSWAVAILALLGVWFARTQPVINGGIGNDGGFYFEMASQIQQGRVPKSVAPFAMRVGTPLLAATAARFSGMSLSRAFFVVNLTAGVFAALCLMIWLRSHLTDAVSRVVVLVFFLVSPYTPFRFTFHYPVLVDSVAMLFVILGLMALDRCRARLSLPRVLALCAVVAIGSVCREIVLVVAVAIIFGRPWPTTVREWALRAMPLVCGALALAAVRYWVTVTPSGYSVVDVVLYWLHWKTAAQMVMAVLFVGGPAMVLLVRYWRSTLDHLLGRLDLLTIVVAYAALSWVGASDTERVLVLAVPVVLMYVGRALDHLRSAHAHAALAVIVVVQVLAYRVVVPIGESVKHLAITDGHVAAWLSGFSVYENFFSFSLSKMWLMTFLSVHAAAMLLITAMLLVHGAPAQVRR